MTTLQKVVNIFNDNQILYFYDDNNKILGNSMVKTVREGNSPVVKNLNTPVSRIEFESDKICVYLSQIPVPQDEKEYYFRVTLVADGYSTGYFKMTPEQARFVNRVADQRNWVLSELDYYSGCFNVDLEDYKTVEEVEN